MTEIESRPAFTDPQRSSSDDEGRGARFVLPWRMHSNETAPWQGENVHSCSCGCGCAKGIKLAKEIRTRAQQLVAELTALRAKVIKLELESQRAARKRKRAKKGS
jgi:hypothetical protein